MPGGRYNEAVDQTTAKPEGNPQRLGVAWVAPAKPLQHLGRVLRPLASGLTEQMVELTAICPVGADTDELPEPPPEIIHYQPARAWALHPKTLAGLAGQIQERKIKLLHALQVESIPLTVHLAKAAGVDYVVSSYSPGDTRRLGKLGAGAAAVLAASEVIHENLTRRKAIDPERIHLVRPGVIQVDRPMCFREPSHSIAIVAGGNLNSFFAFEAVLKTLVELKRRDYDCMCFIIGSGRSERRLRAYADKLGLVDRLSFTGCEPGRRFASMLEAVDIYICAATDRNVELQSLLAMAAGIPVVIAGDLAGDFVADNKTSLRFLLGGKNVLTGKLTSVLDDYEAASAMAQRALSHLQENHSVANMVTLTAGIYRQVAEEGS